MDVAKRLDFDPTDTLPGLQDASQQLQSANMAALHDLQQTVQDLSVATKQKQAQILALARQAAEQGIGDNDLKRLQRQFDSNKSTFINIDQKQRFMKGLWDVKLDIEQLTAAKDDEQQQLERAAEALRTQKSQNEQARHKLASTNGSIQQLYSFVEQATEATDAHLDSTKLALQQHAARHPVACGEPPLEPGPGQDEAQQLIEAETARAKELERSIAASEATLSELEGQAAADRQQLAALRAEVEHMQALLATRAQAADTDKHIKDATAWCEELMATLANTTGLSVLEGSSSSGQLLLGITVRVPTSRSGTADKPLREVHHQLALQLQPVGASGSRMALAGAKVSPACVDLKDLVDAAAAVAKQAGSDDLAYLVREVRGRLLGYWRRQVLVEAAAEVFPPVTAACGPPHVRASLGNQAEVEVLVPLSWPSDAGEALSLVQLSAPGVSSSEAAEIMEAVNADTELLSTCDVLGLLQFVSQLVAEQQQENGGA